MKKARLAAVAFIFLVPLGLLAQSATPSEGYYAGSFSRLSYLVGDVFVQRASDLNSERAEVNLVLVQGDKLGTGIGQAEVQFGRRNYLRLDNHSKVEFVALPTEADDRIKIHVLEGSAYLRIGTLVAEKAVEVHTPDASFYILDEGLYRFNVDPNTQTEVLVHAGSLEAAGEEGSVIVKAMESLMAADGRLLGEPAYFQARDDAFDEWNQGRDAIFAQRSPTRYVPSDIEEYQEELDQNGNWTYEQPYGYVWVPYGVGVDWRPYMYGHWNWYPLCGWTWVSAEPWGWPVYHYGRWHWRFGLGWYWIPHNSWGPAWVHWWWDHDYVGWCPMSWYNRPVVIVGNHFYDRYHDHYFPGDNRAMSVIHRNELQAHDLSRHFLRSDEVGRLDRIELRAEQPTIRPAVGRPGLQSPEGQRIFSARPGMKTEVKNYAPGSSVSSTRLRPRDAGAVEKATGRSTESPFGPSRSASSGREVRIYPSQRPDSGRGESRVPVRERADGVSRAPRSFGEYPSRVGASQPEKPAASRADTPRTDSSRSAGGAQRQGSSSGAGTKSNDPVKHYPSASGETSPAWAPRSASASRVARPDSFPAARVYPSRLAQTGRMTAEYSSRLSSGARAADRVSPSARSSSDRTRESIRSASDHSGAGQYPTASSRSSISQAMRYNPRSYSYSRPASPSYSGSNTARYASATKSGSLSSRSYSAPRNSAGSGARNFSSAPSHQGGSSGRSASAPSSGRSSSSSSSRSSSSSGHPSVRKSG